MAKFKFTKEMLNKMFVDAIKGEPTNNKAKKSNLLETLKAKAGLNRNEK